MKHDKRIMEKKDYVMILKHRQSSDVVDHYTHKDALWTLEKDMADALTLDLEDMPTDIVRLYSWVTVVSDTGWRETIQVVLPYEKDLDIGRLSVQSVLGAFIIGRSEGDTIPLGMPIAPIKIKIEKVEQSQGRIKEFIPQYVFDQMLPKQNNKAILVNI